MRNSSHRSATAMFTQRLLRTRLNAQKMWRTECLQIRIDSAGRTCDLREGPLSFHWERLSKICQEFPDSRDQSVSTKNRVSTNSSSRNFRFFRFLVFTLMLCKILGGTTMTWSLERHTPAELVNPDCFMDQNQRGWVSCLKNYILRISLYIMCIKIYILCVYHCISCV